MPGAMKQVSSHNRWGRQIEEQTMRQHWGMSQNQRAVQDWRTNHAKEHLRTKKHGIAYARLSWKLLPAQNHLVMSLGGRSQSSRFFAQVGSCSSSVHHMKWPHTDSNSSRLKMMCKSLIFQAFSHLIYIGQLLLENSCMAGKGGLCWATLVREGKCYRGMGGHKKLESWMGRPWESDMVCRKGYWFLIPDLKSSKPQAIMRYQQALNSGILS